eukprot:COSAG02_NODE_5803_length_4024_cov_60.505700_6_plen_62_part_00
MLMLMLMLAQFLCGYHTTAVVQLMTELPPHHRYAVEECGRQLLSTAPVYSFYVHFMCAALI